jgi:DNA-directed DNA polymerase III PolC
MFTQLHLHSDYSLLDGMCSFKKLLPFVHSLGQTAVAVTDHGTFHGPIKLYTACEEFKKKTGHTIKPIYGIEVYVTPDIGDIARCRTEIEANKQTIETIKARAKAVRDEAKPLGSKLRGLRKRMTSGKHLAKLAELGAEADDLENRIARIEAEAGHIEQQANDLPTGVNAWFKWQVNNDEAWFGNGTQVVSEDQDEAEGEDYASYKHQRAHLILLARNEQGFYNLMQIATDSQLLGFYGKPRVDINILKKYGQGIIASSACRGGEIPRLILRHREDLAVKLIETYKGIFDEFYLELQPPVVPEQAVVNDALIQLSKETQTSLIATADAHYIHKEDASAHEELMKMQTKGKFWFKEQCYFVHSEAEMRAYGFPEEAITNTQLIADKCNVKLDLTTKTPNVIVPKGYDPNSYIVYQCYQGLMKYLGENPGLDSRAYKERLDFELSVITSKNLSDFMLIIADIINYAKTHDILMGAGRGSSGGSLMCMCLGITDIDPIKYGLLYERFISLARPSCPDIDSDVKQWIPLPEKYEHLMPSGQKLLIQYMQEKYGAEAISRIVAYGTMGTRSILKDAARILGMDADEITAINKLVPSDAGKQWTLKDCLEGSEDGEKQPIERIAQYCQLHPELFDVARELEGNPRHTSTHAAGVILAPGKVRDYFPLMLDKDNQVVCQWDMKDVEIMGGIKLDLLGLRNLGVYERVNQLINARHGLVVDTYKIDRDDEKALAQIKSGKTKGLFQIESNPLANIFKRLKKIDFDTVVAVIALYRPGPMAFVDSFIARANGSERVSYLFPELKPILEDTYGILLYQEQLMRISVDCGGFSKAQSDLFRKAVGKKILDKTILYSDWLVNGNPAENIPGLIANGVSRQAAEQLAKDLVAFASYCFNKSHSVAYAVHTMTTAWYKAHYPHEFMCATLSSYIQKKQEKILLYIQECKDMGIELRAPCVNTSEYEFSLQGDAIVMGLGAVKSLGYCGIDLMEERQRNGKYASLDNFLERCLKIIGKTGLVSLVLSGCLDCFADGPTLLDRQVLIEQVSARYKYGDLLTKFEQDEVKNMINAETDEIMRLINAEVFLLGLQFSEHLLAGKARPCSWKESRFETTVIIKKVLQKQTKKGKPMLIIEVDSLEGKKTLFAFDNKGFEKLLPKLPVGGIRIADISASQDMRGWMYTLENLKYYREEEVA